MLNFVIHYPQKKMLFIGSSCYVCFRVAKFVLHGRQERSIYSTWWLKPFNGVVLLLSIGFCFILI